MFASWVTSRSHWAIQREDRSLKYCLTNLLLIEVWFVWSRHRRGLHLTASEEISFGIPFYRERNDLAQVFEACRERNHLNEIKRSRSGFDSQWNSEMMKLVLFDTFREKIAHIAHVQFYLLTAHLFLIVTNSFEPILQPYKFASRGSCR